MKDMMLKQQTYTYLAISLFLCVLLGSALPASASTSSLLFGQQQAYTGIVRADGSVITYGKIFLENRDTKPLDTTSFYAPKGVTLENVEVYQVTLPERCLDDSKKKDTSSQPNQNSYYNYYSSCENLERQAYSFDGYYSSYDTSDGFIYKKVDAKMHDNTYDFSLSDPIMPGKSGAYIVAYKTSGYSSGALGIYSLAFKSLPVDQPVAEVRVSIDLASDLYTKSGQSQIRSYDKTTSIADGATSAGENAVKSTGLDQLQGSIGRGGSIEKTGKGLVAKESFEVQGAFADASWKLYLKEIALGLLAAVALVGVTVFTLRKANQPTVEPNMKRSTGGKRSTNQSKKTK